MTMSAQTLIAILCTFLASLVLTKSIQVWAVQKQLLDHPNERSSHVSPVPRIGGIAILLATITGVLIAWESVSRDFMALAIAGLLLAIAGLIDDLRPLGALKKCSAQFIAALTVAIATAPEFHISLPYLSGTIHGIPAILTTVFWLITITNVYNFMDGIDGITSGVGIITAVALVAMTGDSTLLLPLAASLAGFLAWNSSPAVIFMGDVGSQFVGFLLGSSVMIGANTQVDVIPIIIVFSPYLFDTGLTIVFRIGKGGKILIAHRTHLYQRLISGGLDHRIVANIYFGATALSTLIAFAYSSSNSFLRLALIGFGLSLLIAYARIVLRFEQRTVPSDSQTLRTDQCGLISEVYSNPKARKI